MGPPIRFILNDQGVESRLHPGTVVLDFLRSHRRLIGTKEGCREGDCGACAVLLGEPTGSGRETVEYRVVNSCLLPLGDVEGKHLVSIEGINPQPQDAGQPHAEALTPVQNQLVENGAIQCGFCTPGFVVSLTGYLLGSRSWSYERALEAIAGNICRCTGYTSIKRAVSDLLGRLGQSGPFPLQGGADGQEHLAALVASGVVPAYFSRIPERLKALEQPGELHPAAGRSLVAGGTDLFVQKPEQMVAEDLSFVTGFPQMDEIRVEKERLVLGAGLTMEAVREIPVLTERLPRLAEELSLFASAPIRNRATLGGNIVNASPIGDFTVMLLALGGVLGLKNGKTVREVPVEHFFRGYKQLDMKRGERLQWVALPLEEGSFSFEKVSRRRHLDIASVNTAAWITARGDRIQHARIAAGGVAPVPLFLSRASASLAGQEVRDEKLEEVLDLAQGEIAPISDVRGSAQYKRLLLRQQLLAHFQKLFPERVHREVWV
jgi:xanthine dehydrogenase small subunit